MPAINAHGEFTPTPENHMTPRPHPLKSCFGYMKAWEICESDEPIFIDDMKKSFKSLGTLTIIN